MAQNKVLSKIAIVGASGRVGGSFVEHLLKTGNHTITALTRADSKSTIPAGVKKVTVDYDNENSIIEALRGQQFFIITMAVTAPRDTHSKLVQAAGKAGVPYVMPNVYGADFQNKGLREENMIGSTNLKHCEEVQATGAAYIAMICGFWYEWSLALGEQWFGFDIKNRKVTFFDDGKTVINTSTWPQCGRALAALLNLPESGASPSVSDWRNKPLYIDSFRVSQRDMLDSLHRVIGTTDKDWEIRYEPTEKRVKDGREELQKGERTGFAKVLYSRCFYPNGGGDFESVYGKANKTLGLPQEELDESTRAAVVMVESGYNPF